MTAHDYWNQNSSDPLGLRDLDAIDPGYDGWAEIESALREHHAGKHKWRSAGTWLAVAAGLVLVISVALFNTQSSTPATPAAHGLATSAGNSASITVEDNIDALIGMSQSMEEQVAKLRQETSSMPAQSAIYVAELEDLIAQVDTGLSLSPDSIDLWGQRVNLLLDLAQVYQQQWQIDYGRIASL
jgi:hypothetical protein